MKGMAVLHTRTKSTTTTTTTTNERTNNNDDAFFSAKIGLANIHPSLRRRGLRMEELRLLYTYTQLVCLVISCSEPLTGRWPISSRTGRLKETLQAYCYLRPIPSQDRDLSLPRPDVGQRRRAPRPSPSGQGPKPPNPENRPIMFRTTATAERGQAKARKKKPYHATCLSRHGIMWLFCQSAVLTSGWSALDMGLLFVQGSIEPNTFSGTPGFGADGVRCVAPYPSWFKSGRECDGISLARDFSP
ncbi:hypothetical protein F4778DRAFT_672309 [Xylariomycetidae sp. FL2044]|nr:hypothetical protein F4778DRAFT_672309 [Xylariomycetidae sp. FL2044]